MKKNLFALAALAALTVSCKKEVQHNEVNVDSTTVVATSDSTKIQENAPEVSVTSYASNDGKTVFTLSTNGEQATLKNETTGQEYQMKSAMSASGAKYEDAEGRFFWTHQRTFSFGKGEDNEIEGVEFEEIASSKFVGEGKEIAVSFLGNDKNSDRRVKFTVDNKDYILPQKEAWAKGGIYSDGNIEFNFKGQIQSATLKMDGKTFELKEVR